MATYCCLVPDAKTSSMPRWRRCATNSDGSRNLLSGDWRPLWITDFPLFEYDYNGKTWRARHHPFTAPRAGDEHHLLDSPGQAFARAYDITLNGAEIGGGSVRIHSVDTQLAMLAALGINRETARRQFGFLLTALESGAPPHGGIAFGLDRMAAMACGAPTIRDVIAFPKTQRGQCLLTGAPATVDDAAVGGTTYSSGAVTGGRCRLPCYNRGMAQTLYDKLWRRHLVHENENGQALLYIDRHLLHEVTSPQAFAGLRASGRDIWRTQSILAVPDHNVPTLNRDIIHDQLSRRQIETLDANCRSFGVRKIDLHDKRQGIVHIIGPEQGMTLPGLTVVCGDSHTSTHGAFGCLAFGIGTSEIEHVLATQCLTARRAKTMKIEIAGDLRRGVFAKDMILYIIGKIGVAGGVGHVLEYAGDAVRNLDMAGRMTVCNMSIEAGARAGMIGVDETTLSFVRRRPLTPQGAQWEAACDYWRTLVSDDEAVFDRTETLAAADIKPQVSWGTSPEMVAAVDGCVPDPAAEADLVKRAGMEKALAYMDLRPGTPMRDIRPDKIFIGSCTNARIEDLRIAAGIVKGRRLAKNIKQALVVPGSGLVREQAEAEGLHDVFMSAGFEWRQPGCSMCLGMNEDKLGAEERCASTSNRNFEGRQGYKSRTHLVSPAMAAAAAAEGRFVDISQ